MSRVDMHQASAYACLDVDGYSTWFILRRLQDRVYMFKSM